MSFTFVIRRAACLTTAAAIFACSDASAPDPISREQVSGSYVTTVPTSGGSAFGSLTFSTTENGITVDQAARGAEIRLVLAADGTTSGSLVVPDVEIEEDQRETFVADLAGTWRVEGNVVRLSHDADTFLRDMPLTVKENRLEGDRTFGGVRVRVVLARQ